MTRRARSAGVLLHLTSLPGPHGSGDLGQEAHAFLTFLSAAGQTAWQTLPIHPVGAGDSPYSATSSFAGNPMLIDLRALCDEGLLRPGEVEARPATERLDYPGTRRLREVALRRAFERFLARRTGDDFDAFRTRERAWLHDYALFSALRAHHRGASFCDWPAPLARHEPAACADALRHFEQEVRYHMFEQWLFDRQWRKLREAAARAEVRLIGDLPIFVSHDSADVWAHQALFQLDAAGRPTYVAGVPPDAFSATGQRWGMPLYRWDALAASGYDYWVARIRAQLARFDLLRLDHFIGFARSWSIPAEADTAQSGHWVEGPGAPLFEALRRALGVADDAELPLIAEDLGRVNEAVRALRRRVGLPTMRVLQFAFDESFRSEHLPHNHPRRAVAYTGTHDTDTLCGWLSSSPDAGRARRYALGVDASAAGQPAHLALIRATLQSPARLAIVPVQDWLGLGTEARMNVPGRADGNWQFRLLSGQLDPALAGTMRTLTRAAGRLG